MAGRCAHTDTTNGSSPPNLLCIKVTIAAENNYAAIELEALAITWVSEKFSDYVLGLQFTVETDHKPLIPLFSTTELCKMPPRIQRFRLRMMRFSHTVQHVPGKQQILADTLSRTPVDTACVDDLLLVEEVEAFANATITVMPASQTRLEEIANAQRSDEDVSAVRGYCLSGWPAYMPNSPTLKPYWENRQHFALIGDLLLYEDRLIIPRSLRISILERLHDGHLRITKCCALSRSLVWWPLLSSSIDDLVPHCTVCAKVWPSQLSRSCPLPSQMPVGTPWY